MHITTIRSLAGNCPVDNVCPGLHKLDTQPERTYVITKVEQDPEVLAAFAGMIGPGEQLGWAPNELFDGIS